MKTALVYHEFQIMFRSKKNFLFLIFLLVMLYSYCLVILPNRETADSFDAVKMKQELGELYIIQRDWEKRGATGFVYMAQSPVYAEREYYYKIHNKMLTAYKEDNFERFLHLRLHYIAKGMGNYTGEPGQYQQSPFPGKDRMHDYYQTLLQYQGYLDEGLPITYELIEQKYIIYSL
ncbi:hypothetical protein [Ornithinibacillus contaminans]|uniref:hypothetical protein n=1 Tax=Ornithinibacillus contaminans TaxID=694055 RepID=UPI00064DAA19|nr:hypothetical protein [Ornithinibacillus contaminans]